MSDLIHDPRLLALGWAILHSLWEGVALGLLVAVVLASLRSAQARYLAGGCGLLACLVLPLGTLALLWPESQSIAIQVPTQGLGALPGGMGTQGAYAPGGVHLSRILAPCLPWAVLIWGTGVLVGGIRVAAAWLWLQRRAARAAVWVPEALSRKAQEMAEAMGVRRRLRIKASGAIDGPITHGWWRPVILVPTAFLGHFPPAYLEALLAHEVAHVARHDFLVNLLQSLVEVVLFYHPVAWWLSHRIRIEREHLCDSLAAKVLGDPLRLARALNALDDAQSRRQALALAARGGQLVNRIRNLVSPLAVGAPRPWAMTALLLLLPSVAFAGAVLGASLHPAQAPGTTRVLGHLHSKGGGRWDLELSVDPSGPSSTFYGFVEPLASGAAPAGCVWFDTGKASPLHAQCGLDLAPTVDRIRVTVQGSQGELGQVTLPLGEGAFPVELRPQDPGHEQGWAEGRLERVPGSPDQLRLGLRLFMSGIHLEVSTPDGQSLGRLKAGGKEGAVGPQRRSLGNPVMLTRLPVGTDRVVLDFQEPATGQIAHIEVALGQGATRFRTELAPSALTK